MKILISCPQGKVFDMFFNDENIELAERLGQVIWNMSCKNMTPSEAEDAIRDCEIYVTYWGSPRLEGRLLKAAKKLRAVIHLGGAVEQIVSQEVYKRGICVLCGEAFYTTSAAEGILACMLAAMRRIPEYSARVKYKNDWRHSWDTSSSIVGRTVGIINYGNVSARLAELLQPFDVDVLMYDKMGIPPKKLKAQPFKGVTLGELCRRSDIIVVNTASYPNAYHMLDAESLQYVKKGALIIDISTDGVINKNFLFTMLLSGRVSAVLDMYERDMEELERSCLFLNNLTVMPRIAGPTVDIRCIVANRLLCECAEYINEGKQPRHGVR